MHQISIIDFKELGYRLQFTNPITELKTKILADIPKLMADVTAYQEKGYYVVGYLTYEAAKAFDPQFETYSKTLNNGYLAYFTVHDSYQQLDFPLSYQKTPLAQNWQTNITEANYQKAIAQIHHQMRYGNTYQVNFTIQLEQELDELNHLDLYNQLMVEQQAGYNAYIAYDDVVILSASPELFFKRLSQTLITRPMKGTTKRGANLIQDKAEANWLANDAKNRSENMMIVDLLRNDMGKICQTGSVKVTSLCQVEQYSTVWQMTSTIEGQLDKGTTLYHIFEALFPCGSITGAPKQSTMSIISQLEENPRGVYCGTIGILFPNGDAYFNVPIRTIQMNQNKATYGVGGGITWESKWHEEWQEIKQKSAILYRQKPTFDLLTTAKVENQHILFYAEHLNRLKEASHYFGYPFYEEKLKQLITDHLSTLDSSDYRLSIKLNHQGQISISSQTLVPLSEAFLTAKLKKQDKPIKDSPFTFFKTTYRPHLEKSNQETIYFDDDQFLLETSIGNLFLEIDNHLYTPPVDFGILPGIFRQSLLEKGIVIEKKLTLDDLKRAIRIFAGNAIRGLYQLTLDD
ncbi:aminodeoxychorismate synthase, component I [Streptococcus urinalis FB127-CNA-2]|uniref:Aminodeoxychorismate synthase, component I n=1 Tax=Streptococcus urinalis 2285-97 TaxID=764291 RepID=G5KDT4_9STRE|nr:aminodeoxychorismate synthase component I [Streptococcus urinalis]EHJ57511.1 aminodeoxychorismate synthase, component I [Streptococcus urinalis 2285-97]EKS17384.1 aminodeoxychorismate synthase, component I [Streptococcus urinalis FB127-CNA-2]VEF32793.1 para-aminobenzoate synthetase componentI/4-amino-4-deoxychorismate lyase [Streptococcus urinalis]